MSRHYSWLINPQTKDYVMADGAPMRDETLQFPAYVRLKVEKEAWMYAPSRDFGSSLSGTTRRQKTTPTLTRKLMEKALEPLLLDGRAVTIDVEVKNISRYGVDTDIVIVDASGQDQTLELRQISV